MIVGIKCSTNHVGGFIIFMLVVVVVVMLLLLVVVVVVSITSILIDFFLFFLLLLVVILLLLRSTVGMVMSNLEMGVLDELGSCLQFLLGSPQAYYILLLLL